MADQQPGLLTDLGGVLFEFEHQHRLEVLGSCLGLAPGQNRCAVVAVGVQRGLRRWALSQRGRDAG